MNVGFIDLFLEYATEAESPTSFFRWAAYAGIAAIARDNVYLDQGIRKVYPNVYVLLLATSAEQRKSVPLDIVADLVDNIKNTKLVRGRTSIQAVVDELAESRSVRGKQIKGGSILLCADELASFLVEDPQAIKILTDIYDYRKEWTYSLRGLGKTKVNNLCVSLLAASNETYLKDVYTQSAVYGGLLGRTFFIKPDEFRKGNSLMYVNKEKYNKTPLIKALQKVSELQGEMILDDHAKKEYDTWYLSLREGYRNKSDKTGVLGRIHTGVLKLAMIIALGNSYSLVIEKDHVEEAITQGMSIVPNYDTYAMGSGKSTVAESGAVLLNELWNSENYSITRKEFLYKHWTEVDHEVLDKLAVTLEGAEMLEVKIGNKNTTYTMTPKCISIFTKKYENGEKK